MCILGEREAFKSGTGIHKKHNLVGVCECSSSQCGCSLSIMYRTDLPLNLFTY